MFRVQREISLLVHDRMLRSFARFYHELAQQPNDQKFGLHQRETISNALSGADPERYVRVRIDAVLILAIEPFRIKFVRIGKIRGIVMNGENGEPNIFTGIYRNTFVTWRSWWQTELLGALSVD